MQKSAAHLKSSPASESRRLSPLAGLLILLVRFYQITLSPILGGSCRFYPTCSHYAVDALRVHGAFKGSYLAVTRILKCHPWNAGGFDPVPERHDHGMLSS